MAQPLLDKHHEDASRITPDTHQHITIDKLKALLPHKTSIVVTEEILDIIHRMETDTGLPQELLEEDLMSYMHVLGGMRGVGLKDLINAIKFCNLKRNHDNKTAWSIVFPDKYDRLIEANMQIDNHVSMYNTSKLVTAIDKEMLIPVHLQYAPYFHAAVKKQYDLMNGKATDTSTGKKQEVSAMVQHLAAKELAVLTKQPEDNKLAISLTPSDAAMSAQQEMNEQLKQIVAHQRKQLESGKDIIDVQVMGINFGEVTQK